MTFYEAAVEILRRTGRPLHFKKITENAIRDELLSHVGKTPESTMESRLDQEVLKEDDAWIVMTRPGVYMLRKEVAERLNAKAAEREAEEAKRREEEAAARAEDSDAYDDEDDDSGDEEEVEASSDEEEEEEDGRRRRGRRGRGRGRRRGKRREESDEDEVAAAADEDQDEDEDDEDEDEDVQADSEEQESKGRSRRRRRRRRGKSSDKDNDKGSEAKAETKTSDDEGNKSRSRGRSRGRDNKKSERKSKRGSLDELDGERFDSIAEAVYAVLAANGRNTLTSDEVSEIVFEKKLIRFHTHDPEATVQSAIVTDNQVRARRGHRPLFSEYRNGRWGLTEWAVSDEGIEKERKIHGLCDELREEAIEQLGASISELKAEAFEMVVMTLLERLDYTNLKVAKRTSEGDTFFTADWRRGFSDLRVCVQIVSDAKRKLTGDDIGEIRDTLEHYAAAEGTIIHLGDVTKEAVRDSRDTDAAKVTVIDREAFTRLLVDEGIGVKTYSTPIVMVDHGFVDALQR